MDAKTEALAWLETADRSPSTFWRMPPGLFFDRLAELIEEPSRIDQSEQNLCGPASLFVHWLRRDPMAVARYAVEMFQTGRASLGSRLVQPSPDSLPRHDYVALRGAYEARHPGRTFCPPADWLLLGSLRDSENLFAAYDGDGFDSVAGITLPAELADWKRRTGRYRRVDNQARWLWPAGVDHALSLPPEADTTLLISTRLLQRLQDAAPTRSLFARIQEAFPNHWAVLARPVDRQGNRVSVSLWSWAETIEGEVDVDGFAQDYYGAVTATPGPTDPEEKRA